MIIYASEKIDFDSENRIAIASQKNGAILIHNDKILPIYENVTAFDTTDKECSSSEEQQRSLEQKSMERVKIFFG
ncbi:MAG: hypothetical protein ACMUJM_11480 [bacterium]